MISKEALTEILGIEVTKIDFVNIHVKGIAQNKQFIKRIRNEK